MADVDAELGSRLARLAESVPVAPWLGHVEPSPVAARQRVRMAWVTPLVVVALVAIGSALFDGPSEPTPGASGSVEPRSSHSQTTVDGDFELTISSPRSIWAVGQPIQIAGSLRYTGPEPSVEIAHGLGARGGPMAFGIVEPIPIGGGIQLDAAYSTIFALPCRSGQPCANHQSCATTTLSTGVDRADGFEKPSLVYGLASETPTQADIQARLAFLNDRELRLPAGTWHVYVIADVAIGSGSGCSGQRMRAELELKVVEPSQSTLPTSFPPVDGSVVETDHDGAYSLQIRSDRRVYRASDAIDVSGAFSYSGGEPRQVAAVWGPTFSIVEPVFGIDVRTMSIRDLVCPASSRIEPGERIERAFAKGGDVATIDPDYEAKQAFLQDPVLRLPPGTWHLRVRAGVQERCSTEAISLSAEIEIVVLPDDSGAVDPRLDGDLPSIDTDGTFVLELVTASGTHEAFESIGLGAWYWYVGPEPTATVSSIDPELEFTITQLDVDGRVIRDMAYEPVCSERSLDVGVRRGHNPFRYYVSRITAATWPASTAKALDNGRLELPPGRWRVTVSLVTALGPCSEPGETHRLLAEAELIVIP